MRFLYLLILFGFNLSFSQSSNSVKQRAGISKIADEGSKTIEVRGQSRNLNMLLKLKSEREAIDFIKLRKNYRPEITSQSF